MKDIKCALKDCVHNGGFSCLADKIIVSGNAVCESYKISVEKLANKMFEIGVDLAKPNYSVDTAIGCDARVCKFNKNCTCKANGITVLGDTLSQSGKQADCATFVKM